MANLTRGRGDLMGVAGSLNDNASVTAPVESYWANGNGLYCMAGNVSEWVADVYRDMSFEDVDEFNPYRGNVFMDLERSEDGTLVEKDSLGRLKYVEMNASRMAGRYNYSKADYRNFNDGDKRSSLLGDDDTGWSGDDVKGSMYTQSAGDFNTLINDNSRVYKGGSWRDKPYWLSPGTRRYLDQTSSRDDLGFRCAMIRVGSPSGY